ncbi:MAG TPA: penicillin-insensitive murein endopeptidase [Pyrinomonadaceae bacterium]|nr:penicillin-insensitive murein endopeptidase [Pyrinomonadaceae bacterium]
MVTRKRSAARKSGAAKKSVSKKSVSKKSRAATKAFASKSVSKKSGGAADAAAAVETVLRRRSEGPEVDKLQEELCDLGYMTRAQKAEGPGKFGPLTEEALRHFQRDNFIDDSGAYDVETQEAIRHLNDGVKRDGEGKVVRGLQNRLVSLGFMTLGQTASGQGKFGPQTEAALISFQQSHGINPSGVLNDETYRALLASVPAPVPQTDHGNPTSIDTVLPAEGRGFTTYRREPGGADQVGRAATIRGVMQVAEEWSTLHASPRLQIGDISRRRGGPFPPHGSHRKGVDVDIRPVTNNGREEPTNIHLGSYSHELTKELCQLIRRRVPGVRIFFNDPRLISLGLTQRLAGHNDHLHVRFPG